MYARIISYPKATAFLLYGGADRYDEDQIHFTPITDFFRDAFISSFNSHEVGNLLFCLPFLGVAFDAIENGEQLSSLLP